MIIKIGMPIPLQIIGLMVLVKDIGIFLIRAAGFIKGVKEGLNNGE